MRDDCRENIEDNPDRYEDPGCQKTIQSGFCHGLLFCSANTWPVSTGLRLGSAIRAELQVHVKTQPFFGSLGTNGQFFSIVGDCPSPLVEGQFSADSSQLTFCKYDITLLTLFSLRRILAELYCKHWFLLETANV